MNDLFSMFNTTIQDNSTSSLGLSDGMMVAKKYKLVQCLERDTMSEMWLAEQVVEDFYSLKAVPHFALKILSAEVRSNMAQMDKILESYCMILGLKHPNIATLHPLEQDDRLGTVFVSEYVPGITLSQYVQTKPGKTVDVSEVVSLLKSIANALDYAHENNVLHRDVKPSNIIVTTKGDSQLIGFSLIAPVQPSRVQLGNAQMNTLYNQLYMAPEQWAGKLPSALSDQYALAVIAYELLAGRLPFESTDPMELGVQVANSPTPPIESLSDSINKALAEAMAKDDKNRFRNCCVFVQALEKHSQESEQDTVQEVWQNESQNFAPHEVLWDAVLNRDLSAVKQELENDPSLINHTDDPYSASLLHYAAFCRSSIEIVKYIISRGADLNAQDDNGSIPLHIAASRTGNSVEIIKCLISPEIDVNAKGRHGCTALHNAAGSNNLEVVKYLISQGADIYATDVFSCTPIHVAVQSGALEVVKYFVSLGMDIHQIDEFGATLLHYAAMHNDDQLEIMKYLISQGIDVNVKDEAGETPLHMAAMYNENTEVLGFLLSQGADVNATNLEGKTPLACADKAKKRRYLRKAGGKESVYVEVEQPLNQVVNQNPEGCGTAAALALLFLINVTYRFFLS